MQSKTYPTSQSNVGSSSNLGQSMKRSIVKIKEMTQQEFYVKRLSKVQQIFSQKGYNLNLVLSEEELIGILDTIGNEPFDREIAAQLLEQVPVSEDPNHPGERFYVLQDFIDTHIKAEYLLLLQADETESEIQQINSQVAYTREELRAQSQNSVVKGSTNSLYVEIFEAACDDQGYQPDFGSRFSVIVLFDRYKYETDEAVVEESPFFLTFNRDFHLKVKNPQESIKILLRDFHRYSTEPDYRELKCTLTLDRFEDQQLHEDWFYLYDQNNNLTPFKIHATIQWKYERTAIPEGTLETLTELQAKLNENKQSIESSLKALVRPFVKANAALKRGDSNRGLKNTNSGSNAALL